LLPNDFGFAFHKSNFQIKNKREIESYYCLHLSGFCFGLFFVCGGFHRFSDCGQTLEVSDVNLSTLQKQESNLIQKRVDQVLKRFLEVLQNLKKGWKILRNDGNASR
jgi:hypothetical protein